MKIKNARYISKNNQINQKFYFAHSCTKLQVNRIYNSPFTVSQCWSLFSEGFSRLKASWNRSIKIVYDLPWPTQRSLIVPISEQTHMKNLLMMRMVSFVNKLQQWKKPVLRQLINLTLRNTCTITGRNLRGILLLTSKSRVEYLTVEDAKNIQYHQLNEDDWWRVPVIKDVLMIRPGELELPEGWSMEEMSELLEEACTSWCIFSIVDMYTLHKQP